MADTQDVATVYPAEHFDADSDIAALRKAMKGLGTDKEAIINIFGQRTLNQRSLLVIKYQEEYRRDLFNDLKDELHGMFEYVVLALLTPLPMYLAKELNDALSGKKQNNKLLVEIICTRSNTSLKRIKNAYTNQYQRSLSDDVHRKNSSFERLLVAILEGNRDVTSSEFDPELPTEIAKKLHQRVNNGDEASEEEFNQILSTSSIALLRQSFKTYESIYEKSLADAIEEQEISVDLKKNLKNVYYALENCAHYLAKEFHSAMEGIGTRDKDLVRLIASRCELDLENIKEEFQNIYNKSLEKEIKGDTSGHYKKMLLILVSSSA